MARAGLGSDWSCLFANDIDPKKAHSYEKNWGGAQLRTGDVTRLTQSDLPGQADLVWASFPCQDLSLAGSGAGLTGSRSGTFWPFWQLICDLADVGRKPTTIVLENVCGLLTSRGGADFAALCNAVAQAGYWVGAIVVDAALFVPQSRPRLFVIAIAQEQPIAGRVQSPYAVDAWHPPRLRIAQAGLSEVTRANWLWFSPVVVPKRIPQLADLIEHDSKDVEWHSTHDTDRLLRMMSTTNRAKVELVARNSAFTVGTIYKRTRIENDRKMQRAEVRFDLAGCLRTPGGGSSRQTLIVVENGLVRTRLVSPRETARLMGLPDDYKLPARSNDAYHLTGDGVVVPVVRHIVGSIVEPCLALPALLRATG